MAFHIQIKDLETGEMCLDTKATTIFASVTDGKSTSEHILINGSGMDCAANTAGLLHILGLVEEKYPDEYVLGQLLLKSKNEKEND